MTDIRCIAAEVAEPFFLERQLAQCVIDVLLHFANAPRRPRPELRQPIIENRNAPLLCRPRHVPNDAGSYELMMCTRDDNKWAPAVLSRLAKYTHDAAVHLGDTMDLAHAVPRKSTLAALLFARPPITTPQFEVLGKPASLVLCMGITAAEFAMCKSRSSSKYG